MSGRDRSLLGVVVLVVVAVAGYFLVVQPKHHQASQIQSQITSEKTALLQAESQLQADERAESEYRTYVQQLKGIAKAVPADEQIPELINELQAASTRSRVGFEAVSTSSSATATSATTTSSASAFPSQSFNLAFTGNYFAVADLLGRLASFVRADDKHFHVTGRLLTIASVALTPGSSSLAATAASGDVTASVTADDYDIPSAISSSSTTSTAGSGSTS